MMMPSIFGENLFDDWMDFPFDDDFFRRTPSYSKKSSTSVMRTDIRDTDDSYVGNAIHQDDIRAKYADGILKISVPKKTKKEVEQANYISIEG